MWSQVGPLLQRTEVRSHNPNCGKYLEGKGLISTYSHILILAVVTRGLSSLLYIVNIPSLLRHEAKADF